MGALTLAALDIAQAVIGLAGLIPVLGNVADGINAGISVGRGNYQEAILDGASAVPGAGQATGAVMAGIRGKRAVSRVWNIVSGGATKTGGVGHRTLEPGPYAAESIPARSTNRDFTSQERDSIDRIGQMTECHTCGRRNPGTKSGHFVPDHQPVSSLATPGTPQKLFPQCITCSRAQGLAAANELRMRRTR